ncbi:MAG: universal stress protein UspA [Sneathiella sp.]|jgi:nucleotide-binding universal stress UspA family protein|uniref:universal stress protein n=1 Tax=Sneathiella sp. TaxID=1964365 RepID=UPI000C4A99E8|nr:universal stress protein [Sneathiella sp.]MAL78046.1 universal stress protein UspA [Sneathiella sp.]
MFKKILIPVDGSEPSQKAMEMAVNLQKSFDCELYILTVFRHHSLLEASLSMVRSAEPEVMDDILRKHASSVAESAKKAAQELGAEKVRAFVKNGPPARTIVSFAKDKDVDLIVLGSRGHGDVEGFLLGSVSHKVTSLAKCPVMVV